MRSNLSLGAVGFFAALAGMFVAFTIGVAMFMATYDSDSGGGGDDEEPTGTPVAADVTISANNVAFDTDALTTPAGRDFTLLFQNLESVPHNVSIFTEQGGQSLFTGEIVTGTDIVYNVPALDPGDYFFVCDVHPQQMTGTLTADPNFAGAAAGAETGTAAAETGTATAETTASE
jgi:plastocyanin